MDKFPQEIKDEFKRLARECKYKLIVVLIGLLSLIALQHSCSRANRLFGLPDDHQIEAHTESLIKHTTGISLDLTPED